MEFKVSQTLVKLYVEFGSDPPNYWLQAFSVAPHHVDLQTVENRTDSV